MEELEIRAYARSSKLRRKVLGVPVAGWLGVLLIAAVVAAQVIGSTMSKPQTIQAVTLTDGSSPNGIEVSVTYGTTDWHNTTATSSSGTINGVYIRLVVVGLKCSDTVANPSILTLKEKT